MMYVQGRECKVYSARAKQPAPYSRQRTVDLAGLHIYAKKQARILTLQLKDIGKL